MDSGFLGQNRIIKGPWQAFERAIARLLAHKGWDSYDVVGGAWDKGADVIGSKDGEEKIFQVKFSINNHPLSVDIVGDVKRAIEFYKIENGVCVSNRMLGPEQKRKLAILKNQGYNIETFIGEAIYNSFAKMPDWPVEKKPLRQYQRIAVDRLIEAYESGLPRGLIVLATGLGKTFVAANFLRYVYEHRPETKILILADKKELLIQFDRGIWTNLPKHVSTHLLYDNEKPSYTEGIILSTFQSFEGFYHKNPELYFDIVIVDEAHHAPASTFLATINTLSPKFLVGLTATPFRTDDLSVTSVFGTPLVKVDIGKAMQMGYLANVSYKIKNDNIDTDWVAKASKKGYTIRQLNKKLFIPERDEEICKTIMDYWNYKTAQRGIIFCNSSGHAEIVEQLLRTVYNFPARALTTKVTDPHERAKRLRLFRTGEIKILTCYNMLNEGVDVPDVDFLVYLRVTHSRIVFLQQLGRGLRYKEGKTLLVLDFVADLRRLAGVKSFSKEILNVKDDDPNPGEFEKLHLPSQFQLEFFDQSATDFINLVQADESELENSNEDDIVYLK